jgi:hypothetical protein
VEAPWGRADDGPNWTTFSPPKSREISASVAPGFNVSKARRNLGRATPIARRMASISSGVLIMRTVAKAGAAETAFQPGRAERSRSTSSNAVEGSTPSVPAAPGKSATAFANGSSVSSHVTTFEIADMPRRRLSSNEGQITTGSRSAKRNRAVSRSLRQKSIPVR